MSNCIIPQHQNFAPSDKGQNWKVFPDSIFGLNGALLQVQRLLLGIIPSNEAHTHESPCIPLQELRQLEAQIRDTSLYVEVDTRRNLDINGLIADVRAQYDTIAAKSRADAEDFYKVKVMIHEEHLLQH